MQHSNNQKNKDNSAKQPSDSAEPTKTAKQQAAQNASADSASQPNVSATASKNAEVTTPAIADQLPEDQVAQGEELVPTKPKEVYCIC